jgi:hypothetical protein
MTLTFFARTVGSTEWPAGWAKPFYYNTFCCVHSVNDVNNFYHFSMS